MDAAQARASSPSEGEARQFVTFRLGEGEMGLALQDVQEIIRVPDVVQVPLSPPALLGIANLRGAVLPVASLRHVFGLEDKPLDDTMRVVVVDCGTRVGLLVDRMSSVLTVDAADVDDADQVREVVRSELVDKVLRRPGGARALVFEARRVLEEAFARPLEAREERVLGTSWDAAARADDEAAETDEDERQLVSFEVDGQEYAFAIDRVKEIVTLPAEVCEVPRALPSVLGLMVLRERNLPLVDLRRLLGLPVAANAEGRRVVVTTGYATPGLEVGVVVDTVREVLRIGASQVDEVPPLLRSAGEELQGVLRLERGQRVVTLIDLDRVVDVGMVREAAGEDEEMLRQTSEHAHLEVAEDDEQLVIFRLESERYGVPVGAVQESVRVPEELTVVPKAPPWMEGIINLRGEVLPVIDQRVRFGLPAAERSDRQRILVLKLGEQQLGFIVDSVSEVRKISRGLIGPAPALSEEQAELIRRVANLGAKDGMILLLEPDRMVSGLEARRLAEVAGEVPVGAEAER